MIILNNKGISIMITILILSSMLIASLGAADILNKSLQNTKTSTHSSIAYLAAESGAERVIWKEAKGAIKESVFEAGCDDDYINLETEECGEYNHPVGVDSYYKMKYKREAPYHIYTSIGYYFNTRRSVEIRYAK